LEVSLLVPPLVEPEPALPLVPVVPEPLVPEVPVELLEPVVVDVDPEPAVLPLMLPDPMAPVVPVVEEPVDERSVLVELVPVPVVSELPRVWSRLHAVPNESANAVSAVATTRLSFFVFMNIPPEGLKFLFRRRDVGGRQHRRRNAVRVPS
jgi:hypothetical protein